MATNITLPGHRKRKWAQKLLQHQRRTASPAVTNQYKLSNDKAIKVICISDTHNHQPNLPAGDILLHAGDLTEWGSFDELQTQLTWLSGQPHRYKVVIAGNHDVLLDSKFMSEPETASRLPWSMEQGKEASDLDFGSCIYLDRSEVTLSFENGRKLKVYGCPITPVFGSSAFQVPRDRGGDVWTGNVPSDTDILLTHGPPRGRLETFPPAGCVDLLREVMRVRPRLVVFGHIHVGHGREDVVFNSLRRNYEGIMSGWKGYGAIVNMTFVLLRLKVCGLAGTLCGCLPRKQDMVTTLINAAVVGGYRNELVNDATVIEI